MKLVTSKQLRHILGNVSDMTIWRYLQNETLGFPKPRYINKRRYWVEDELHDWINTHAEKRA